MGKQTILFDGYWLASGPPSGRNVVQSLIEGWVHAFPEDVVRVAVPFAPTTDVPDGVEVVTVPSPVRNHGAWVMSALPRVMKSTDLTLTQNFSPPSPRTRRSTVATFVHDAICQQHPEWFTTAERLYLAAAAFTLFWSDVVLTSSQTEADRIGRQLRFARGKVAAIGLGVPVGLTRSMASQPAGFDDDTKFVLAVGRLNVRKNLGLLIEAFSRSKPLTDTKLVVVGAANGLSDMAGTVYADPRVLFVGSVSDPELRWLYENCRAFAFPSLDEGFGLPLIEAEYFGAPSVASAIPAFVELGVARHLFDPTDVSSIGDALTKVVMAKSKLGRGAPTDLDPTWLKVAARAREAVNSSMEAPIA